MSTVSIWTASDTSESGPTVDDETAAARIEADDAHGASGWVCGVLHITTITDDGGLWTIALNLDRTDARAISDQLADLLGHKASPAVEA